MDDVIDVAHRLAQAFSIPHVADEEAHGVLAILLLHFVLLQFVPGIDDDPAGR